MVDLPVTRLAAQPENAVTSDICTPFGDVVEQLSAGAPVTSCQLTVSGRVVCRILGVR